MITESSHVVPATLQAYPRASSIDLLLFLIFQGFSFRGHDPQAKLSLLPTGLYIVLLQIDFLFTWRE